MGAEALLIEVDTAAEVAAWHAECLRRREAGVLHAREIVPAARTVLLAGVAPDLAAELPTWVPAPVAVQDGREVTLEVTFDGPDLAFVAAHWGLSVDDAVAALLKAPLRAAFSGFAPGFTYLTGVPATVPRRSEPRASVPAGAFALAGEHAGVYPRRSPGGWQLVGSTAAIMFDPERERAALLAPGDRVRLVAT